MCVCVCVFMGIRLYRTGPECDFYFKKYLFFLDCCHEYVVSRWRGGTVWCFYSTKVGLSTCLCVFVLCISHWHWHAVFFFLIWSTTRIWSTRLRHHDTVISTHFVVVFSAIIIVYVSRPKRNLPRHITIRTIADKCVRELIWGYLHYMPYEKYIIHNRLPSLPLKYTLLVSTQEEPTTKHFLLE